MFLKMHPPERQRVEVFPVHFDEFDDEVWVVEAHVLEMKFLCIVVLKVIYSFVLKLLFESRDDVAFDHKILAALLWDGLAVLVTHENVASDVEVFNEVILLLQQLLDFFSDGFIELVVFEVEVEQIGVIIQTARELDDFITFDLILSDVQVFKWRISFE